jgi:hypothetical protein
VVPFRTLLSCKSCAKEYISVSLPVHWHGNAVYLSELHCSYRYAMRTLRLPSLQHAAERGSMHDSNPVLRT